jgi:hypothetical protein
VLMQGEASGNTPEHGIWYTQNGEAVRPFSYVRLLVCTLWGSCEFAV